MQLHIAYWNDYMGKGMVLAFGLVLDPQSVYGLGLVEVESEQQNERHDRRRPGKRFKQV